MHMPPMHDYAELARTFRWALPPTFNFGRDVVDRLAQEADKPALIWSNDAGEERHFRFSDIARRSAQVAHALAEAGIRRGDRVLVQLPRIPEWQIGMVACLKLGAVPIPCIEMLTEKDVRYRADHSGARGAITTAANAGKFARCQGVQARLLVGGDAPGWRRFEDSESAPHRFECADVGIDEPALLFYTSGSSGNPKGVLHASRALFAWRLSAAYWQTLSPQDLIWCTADTGWSKAGTGVLFSPWSRGSTVFFHDGRFDAQQRLALLARHGVTVFCAAATEFRQLVAQDFAPHDLSALRLSVSAGESVNPEVIQRWQDLAQVPLLEGYGQTETLMTVLNYPALAPRVSSMGQPLPGVSMAVLGDDDRPAPAGTVGRLAMALPNPQFMLGYWNDPQRTAESIVEAHGQRWWLTGDQCARDQDGYLFYSGRADDIISSAGYRIGPTEVENALQQHEAVRECAVVGSPDAQRGEIVKAFVVLHPGHRPDHDLVLQLQEHTRQATAPYKYPRKIAFVEELPKNASGKVLRRVLREAELRAAVPAETPSPP